MKNNDPANLSDYAEHCVPNAVTPEELPTRLMLSTGALQHQAQRCQPPPGTSAGSPWYRSVWVCQGVLNRSTVRNRNFQTYARQYSYMCVHTYTQYTFSNWKE